MRFIVLVGLALAGCSSAPPAREIDREALLNRPEVQQLISEAADRWVACVRASIPTYDDRISGAEVVGKSVILACSSLAPDSVNSPLYLQMTTAAVLQHRAAAQR